MTIQTFEDRFGQGAQDIVAARFAKPGDALPVGVYLGAALTAEVDQGRWVVRCPDCAGAELMADSGLFFCCNCRNQAVGHAYRRVTPPSKTQRAQIEAALLARPEPENRNWLPSESVADLLAENAVMLEDV